MGAAVGVVGGAGFPGVCAIAAPAPTNDPITRPWQSRAALMLLLPSPGTGAEVTGAAAHGKSIAPGHSRIQNVLAVNPGLDRRYLEKWGRDLGVLDLWREIAGH